MRVRIAKAYHLLLDLCGRPCSKRHRLPCVPEGPLFFAAAFSAGERAPFRKCGRGCVVEGAPRVHAGAPGSKIKDFFIDFANALLLRGETDAFWAFVRRAQDSLLSKFECLKEK